MVGVLMTEWVFLVSILSGAFTPNTETGWQNVQRERHAYVTLAECEAGRSALYRQYRQHPIEGGGVIITGCQPEHRDRRP